MQTVVLLFGGESSEHDVSVASALNVDEALDKTKYAVSYGYIDPNGVWWHVPSVSRTIPDDAAQLLPVLGKRAFAVEGSDLIITPDVILPVLHGRNGEDGSVQALAQLLHVPIVGCDMTSSAAAMNKYITKEVAAANDINVVPFAVHYAADMIPKFSDLSLQLSPILFVKPANAGSSVGVRKVRTQAELEAALEEAHRHDEIALIEKAIDARELEVAVLGNYPNVEASAVAEIQPDGEFYSYESKYDEDSSSIVSIPAPIPEDLSTELRHQAAKVFSILGGSGLARVDFFVEKGSGTIYLNELNTFPGFTNISVYPKAWEAQGISYAELIDRLIVLALEKK
jgi:D-alanine-D-alanine ligase